MKERLRSATEFAMGIAMLVAMGAILIFFVRGAAWAAENLLVFAAQLSGWALWAVVLVLPLAIFRRTRGFAGTVWFFSSFAFGLVAWLYGFALTYQLWGGLAVVVGLFFFGVGVVFLALLATAVNGLWEPFWTLLFMSFLVFFVRVIGAAMHASYERGQETASQAIS